MSRAGNNRFELIGPSAQGAPRTRSNVGRKEGNLYLTTHSTHFIYGYMASDIW